MNPQSQTSNELKASDATPLRARVLESAGRLATLGNLHKLSPIELRRIGAGALAIVALAPASFVAKRIERGADYSLSSDIPTTKASLDPAKDKLVSIPETGAFNLASKVDPGHDPRNGVNDFTEQLGHDPQPGDMVAVPVPGPGEQTK